MKRILLLLVCMVAVLSLHAQSQRMYVPVSADSTTIVRNWTDGYVVYGQKEDNVGYFALVDNDSNVVYCADSIGEYRVTDFVVDSDSVFFVGVRPDGDGVVGCFDIDSLFHHGRPIHYAAPDPHTLPVGMDAQSSIGFFRDFDHVVSFADEQGVRHIVFIGSLRTDTRYTEFHTVIDTIRYLLDWTHGSASIKAATRIRENEWFDDVILDGKMVVVGGRMLPVGDSSTSLVYRFLPCKSTCLTSRDRFVHKYNFCAQPLLLQKAGAAGVSFCSVFRSKDMVGNAMLHTLGYECDYDNIIMYFRRVHKYTVSDSSFIKGTTFVTGNNTLCILLGSGVGYPPYYGSVLQCQLSGLASVQKYIEHEAVVNSSSIDFVDSLAYVVGGFHGGELWLWMSHSFNDVSNCFIHSIPTTTDAYSKSSLLKEEAPLSIGQYSVADRTIIPTVTHVKSDIHCESKSTEGGSL